MQMSCCLVGFAQVPRQILTTCYSVPWKNQTLTQWIDQRISTFFQVMIAWRMLCWLRAAWPWNSGSGAQYAHYAHCSNFWKWEGEAENPSTSNGHPPFRSGFSGAFWRCKASTSGVNLGITAQPSWIDLDLTWSTAGIVALVIPFSACKTATAQINTMCCPLCIHTGDPGDRGDLS